MNNNYIGVDLDLFRQPKIQRLELKLGKAGVGLYIQLCLKLTEQEGKISINDIPILSREFFIKEELIKEVLEFDNLFVLKDNYFSCEWVTIRILASKEKSQKARKAILSRWKNKGSNTDEHTDVLPTKNKSSTIKENKTKVKEIKLNNKEKIETFFQSENLKEIIESKLIPYENQTWFEEQAKSTIEIIKNEMVNYYFEGKGSKIEIKDIKARFIKFLQSFNRNRFYKYQNNFNQNQRSTQQPTETNITISRSDFATDEEYQNKIKYYSEVHPDFNLILK